jgi:DNA-directed RNA polymerase specialized sigma24 family protein
MGSTSVFTLLQDQDWGAISKQMIAFAIYLARNYRWRKGRCWDLALGRTVEDMVQEVIVKTIEGRRGWDPRRGPLVPWMRDQVKSEIDHLCRSAAHRREVLDPASMLPEPGTGVGEHMQHQREVPTCRHSQNPEAVVLKYEEIEQREKALLQAANEDSELEEIVDAIRCGCIPKPGYLAAEIGVPVKNINNRLKRLRRRAMKLMEENEP